METIQGMFRTQEITSMEYYRANILDWW